MELVEIERLRRLATDVINKHANAGGLCSACGSAFPCQRALLAEHNAALVSDGHFRRGGPALLAVWPVPVCLSTAG
jgi:hypothetical protein